MGRQLAVTDRTDLSFFAGWKGCYVDYQPATYLQLRRLVRTDFDSMDEDVAEAKIVELVKERVVGGKVRVLGEGGEPELVDLELDDIDSMPAEMVGRLYADMTGVKYDADPLEKTEPETESSTATGSSKPQATTSTTETQSSEE